MIDAVLVGTYGEEEKAILHTQDCVESVKEVIVYRMNGKHASIMALDCQGMAAVVEVMSVTGMERGDVTWASCCCKNPPRPGNGSTQVRVSEIGAMIVSQDSKRYVVCPACGGLNVTFNITCEMCRVNLWSWGVEKRLYEYNRRLREALKNRDMRGVGTWRAVVKRIVSSVRGGDWSVTSEGLAVRTRERRSDRKNGEEGESEE